MEGKGWTRQCPCSHLAIILKSVSDFIDHQKVEVCLRKANLSPRETDTEPYPGLLLKVHTKFSGHKTEFEKINYIGYKIIQVKNLKKIYVIHTCSIVF